jgi:hypothetical protein
MEKTDVCKATVDTRFSLNTYDELLTLCARIQTSASHESQIQTIINRGIDFEKLLQKATWQRLQGLVAAHLSASYLENVVPITVKDQCMAIRRQILFRNVLLQNETARLLALFHEEHIPIIVLKGAALLDTVYNDISLRPMGDLDVLVHSNDLDRAETLASNAGYWCPVDEATQEKTRKYGQHIPLLVHSEKGIIFEIHHHIVGPESPYRGSIDSFWERARATEIGGVPAHMLSPEHMIIHQCIKFLLDRRYQSAKSLGQLCDIAEIITRYQDCLDWDLIG